MIAFLRKVAAFLSIASILYVSLTLVFLPKLLPYFYGPNIEDQVKTSFNNAESRNYSILILGNSRMYSGVNPDQFSEPTYNFSHNNDTFNQMYYKLTWLLSRGKRIEKVILGVDYFQFNVFSDTRNYVYADLLGPDYLSDYKGKSYWISYYRELLRPYRLRALVREPIYRHELKSNGQFVRRGEADPGDFIRRSFGRLEIQERYFKKILETCASNNIRVFLCMPPLRDVEIQQYNSNQVEDFKSFIASFTGEQVTYLDYSVDTRFAMEDFIDFSHLGPAGADKFSALLNENVRMK